MTSDRDLFALSLCDLLLLLQLVSTEMQRRLVGPAQPPVFEHRALLRCVREPVCIFAMSTWVHFSTFSGTIFTV